MITLKDGSGGVSSFELVEEVFMPFFKDLMPYSGEDGGIFSSSLKLATSTDSFIIDPYFFNGGDIGKLSVCGSCNDCVMMGAIPKYINISFIIEEGFSKKDLKIIAESIAKECKEAGLKILSSDTKVLPKFSNKSNIFINTTCIGEVVQENLSAQNIKEGDDIILSASIGNHGSSIFILQNDLGFKSDIQSDCANLSPLLNLIFQKDFKIKALRDATRGGIASVLNEWAISSNIAISVNEKDILIEDKVSGVCEILGLDAFSLANEGVAMIACDQKDSSEILKLLQSHPLGKNAKIIGRAENNKTNSKVTLKTRFNSSIFLEYPQGEILPRIC